MRTSISSHGALVCSIHTLLQKYNNMTSLITGLLFTLVLIILGSIDEIK